MIGLFKLMGVVMALYGLYAIFTGQVYSTRDRQTFDRYESPFSFWTVAVGYVVVGGLIFFAMWYRYGLL